MQQKGFIKLRISGQNLNFEEISRMLAQQPSFTCRKGDCYTPKFGDKKPVIYEEDCWLLETEKDGELSFDDAIKMFLSKVKKSTDYLKELSSGFDVTLWISAYPDEQQSNIHLSPDTLKMIADMGISVDMNSLFLKELYDGTYKD